MAGSPVREQDSDVSSIKTLRSRVVDWGFDIERNFRDDRGVFCIRIGTPRNSIYCITKKYKYKNMASFPLRVVRRADDYDCPVCIFFDDPTLGSGYVFDAETVKSEGMENKQDVPLPNRSKWIDIDLEYGVVLGDYIHESVDLESTSES